MMKKTIKEFKIIEHFINRVFNLECGLYEIETENECRFIVQTKNDYKVISHSAEGKTNFYNATENIIQEIKELSYKRSLKRKLDNMMLLKRDVNNTTSYLMQSKKKQTRIKMVVLLIYKTK